LSPKSMDNPASQQLTRTEAAARRTEIAAALAAWGAGLR
jgi:hypothetical protein